VARVFRKLAQLLDVNVSGVSDGDALVWDDGTQSWVPGAGGGGGGAPTDVDYLVGTASGDLSAEIVVGTSPGGELGGTWASPTVDTTHSGSSHASVQSAAEATAASALSSHASDTTGVHGISDTSALATSASVSSAISTSESGQVRDGDAAGGVLGGTYPNPSFAADMATQAELDAHLNDTSDAHDASAISIADAANDFTATDVEGALAELQSDAETDAQNLADHLADTSAAHAASAVSVNSATLSGTGTDVQASLEEIDNLLDDHSARHEDGGADEISLTGLSGAPADTVNKALVDAKGDLIVASGADAVARLAVGADGQVLKADAAATNGVKWAGAYSYVLVRDEKTQNTDGGTATSGSFQTRTLNTESSDADGVCSLSSNKITLAAGTYECVISTPAWRVGRHQARLQNVTDASTVLVGTTEYASNLDASGSFGPMTRSLIIGRFTIAASKELEVQHRVETTKTNNGFGVGCNFTTEVYTVAEFRKVA